MRDNSRRFWEDVWRDDKNHDFWKRVSPDAIALIEKYSAQKRPEVLDLGCGLGRNAIAFADAGYNVTATDFSQAALSHLQKWADRLNLKVGIVLASFLDDIFRPESFDIVISINVIYHCHREEMNKAVQHVNRWLKPGGIFYFTCPAEEDTLPDSAAEIALHTYEIKPGHIHFHADNNDLEEFLRGFKRLSCQKHEHHWDDEGVARVSFRWQMLVEKPIA